MSSHWLVVSISRSREPSRQPPGDIIPIVFERGAVTAVIVAIVVSVAAATSAPAATKRVSRDNCSFSFDYPQSWTAVENPEAAILDPEHYNVVATCAVGLRPPGWESEMRDSPLTLRPYPVRLVFWNRSFADSARRSCFVRVSDLGEDSSPGLIRDLNPWDWGIWIRQGIDVARQFTTPCCQGVRGTSWGHDRAKDGSKASIIWECAVINDRRRHSVVVQADGEERFHDVVNQIIDTMSFAVVPAP